MPYQLTEPLVSTYSYEIKKIVIDLENNLCTATLECRDSYSSAIDSVDLNFSLFDSFGNLISPNTWPEENPSAAQIYQYIKEFVYRSLQDQPGLNGIGAGEIS